jgi:hypothetical protein
MIPNSSGTYLLDRKMFRSRCGDDPIRYVPVPGPPGPPGTPGTSIKQWTEDDQSLSGIYRAQGNVGIGTSHPLYPLEVKGTLHTQDLLESAGTLSVNKLETPFSVHSVLYDTVQIYLRNAPSPLISTAINGSTTRMFYFTDISALVSTQRFAVQFMNMDLQPNQMQSFTLFVRFATGKGICNRVLVNQVECTLMFTDPTYLFSAPLPDTSTALHQTLDIFKVGTETLVYSRISLLS